MEKLKHGDMFVFNNSKRNRLALTIDDFTIGKIYSVFDDGDSLAFEDDEGDARSAYLWLCKGSGVKFTKIVG